jgi:5'-phosphate synthase pdxT subunit
VRVRRNAFGRQINSFVAELDLAFLDGLAGDAGAGGVGLGVAEAEAARGRPFKGVFIRAPVVESILPSGRAGRAEAVEVLAILPREEEGEGREPGQGDGDGGTGGRIVAVRQGRIFGTSFHPELTDDCRIHLWWLQQVWEAMQQDRQSLESR